MGSSEWQAPARTSVTRAYQRAVLQTSRRYSWRPQLVLTPCGARALFHMAAATRAVAGSLLNGVPSSCRRMTATAFAGLIGAPMRTVCAASLDASGIARRMVGIISGGCAAMISDLNSVPREVLAVVAAAMHSVANAVRGDADTVRTRSVAACTCTVGTRSQPENSMMQFMCVGSCCRRCSVGWDCRSPRGRPRRSAHQTAASWSGGAALSSQHATLVCDGLRAMLFLLLGSRALDLMCLLCYRSAYRSAFQNLTHTCA